MKKFTSLFALLSCLCVVSAQADDVTVYISGTYPDYQHVYWFNATAAGWNQNPDFNDAPIFTSLSTTPSVIGDKTYYPITLTPTGNDIATVIFYDNHGGTPENQYNGRQQTKDIQVVKGVYYLHYNGYTDFSTCCLTGDFNDWKMYGFTPINNTTWTYTWDLSNVNSDFVKFKIRTSQDTWMGYNSDLDLSEIPNGWFENSNDENNIKFNYKSTGYSKFNLTATWQNGSLKLNIVGVGPLHLSDNTPISKLGGATSAESIKYTRDYNSLWGTLCLPFTISNTQTGITFYELSNVSETSMTFSVIDLPIQAGTPVVFKLASAGNVLIEESSNVSLTSTAGTSTNCGWTLNGTFEELKRDNIYFIYNNTFYHGSNITIKPYRAWFNSNGNSAPLRIEEADTEGLQFVEQEDGTVKAYYDLQGRKLDGTHKGLIIENGKIIMVK